MNNPKTINKELKDILAKYKDSYKSICETSRAEYMQTLPAGAEIPKEGVIYGDKYKAAFESKCLEYKNDIRKIMNDTINDLKAKATEAPSTEAVNAITLLNMRKNVTKTEIDDMLNRYGDNVQAWRTIVSIANDNDLHDFRQCEVDAQFEQVEGLSRSLENSISANKASQGYAGAGFMSLIEAQIDGTFPAEV